MQEITSTTNEIVKEASKLLQKKYRTETKLFILEGEKAVKEAQGLGIAIQKIFVLSHKVNKFSGLNEKTILVNEAVMKKISDTQSPPEILAIAQQIELSPEKLKSKSKLVLLEEIKDNGNLGTIIRTCVALGIEGIILAGDCADIYNPKTVRSAAGNLFKIPIVTLKDIQSTKKLFPQHTFISTILDGDDIEKITAPTKFIVMFGSEASGLSEDAQLLADLKATIPMSSNVESLNLATSVSIVVWEFSKKSN